MQKIITTPGKNKMNVQTNIKSEIKKDLLKLSTKTHKGKLVLSFALFF
jgi:hypothetical protein